MRRCAITHARTTPIRRLPQWRQDEGSSRAGEHCNTCFSCGRIQAFWPVQVTLHATRRIIAWRGTLASSSVDTVELVEHGHAAAHRQCTLLNHLSRSQHHSGVVHGGGARSRCKCCSSASSSTLRDGARWDIPTCTYPCMRMMDGPKAMPAAAGLNRPSAHSFSHSAG